MRSRNTWETDNIFLKQAYYKMKDFKPTGRINSNLLWIREGHIDVTTIFLTPSWARVVYNAGIKGSLIAFQGNERRCLYSSIYNECKKNVCCTITGRFNLKESTNNILFRGTAPRLYDSRSFCRVTTESCESRILILEAGISNAWPGWLIPTPVFMSLETRVSTLMPRHNQIIKIWNHVWI